MPNVVDLFAGVGGLSLGASRAGFDVVASVENDPHANAAHARNFPSCRHSAADVAELDGERLLDLAGLQPGQLDGLIGGPPCQGFSVIGRREQADPRNDLFVKFYDLVAETQPKFFVAENVYGILNPKYASIIDTAKRRLGDAYTCLEPMPMHAYEFGAPTIRRRVFFIGFRHDDMDAVTPQDIEDAKTQERTDVQAALHGLPREIDDQWLEEEHGWRTVETMPDSYFYDRVRQHIPENVGNAEALRRYENERQTSGCLGTRHTADVTARYEALAPGERDETSKSVRLRPNGYCPALRAGTDATRGSYQAVRPVHPDLPRVITPREAARLQGFPDWFRFAPSKWHSFRQIGNSVSPLVGEAVLSAVSSKLR